MAETEQILAVLNRIADAIFANAEATYALAQATAGEPEEEQEEAKGWNTNG